MIRMNMKACDWLTSPVDNPGVNEALTHEVIHSRVEIKTVKISRDAAALILKHAYIILHMSKCVII